MFSSQSNLSMAPPLPPLPKFDENFEIIETPPPLPELSEKLQAEMELDMRVNKVDNTNKRNLHSIYKMMGCSKNNILYGMTAKMISDYLIIDDKKLSHDEFIKFHNYKLKNGQMRFVEYGGDWFDMRDCKLTFEKNKTLIKHNNRNYDINKAKGRHYFYEYIEEKYNDISSKNVRIMIREELYGEL